MKVTGKSEGVTAGEKTKTFTGRKLEYVRCIMFDPKVPSWAFEIACCIMSHLNQYSLRTMLSDETVADETGASARTVRRARNLLRRTGWLKWKRTRTANIYTPLFDRMDAMLDGIQDKRDARQIRRKDRLERLTQDRPELSELDHQDRPLLSEQNRPDLAEQDRPRLADIHLSENT